MNGDTPSSTPSRASTTEPQAFPGGDAFLPLVLIALSLILVFIWQLTNISKQRSSLRASQEQYEAAAQNAATQLDQQIPQSRAVQAKLESLVTDVLNLAKEGDADAKAIKEKYKIEQQGAAAGAVSASPSPAASR
jgi:hypothetical protein